MKLTSEDKELILTAIGTEEARLQRAINAAKVQGIKEILQEQIRKLQVVAGLIVQEPLTK